MKRKIENNVFLGILALIITSVFFTSCKENTMEGLIVATKVPINVQKAIYIKGKTWRYFPKSQIVLLDPNKSNESLKVLTKNFYAACAPQISYDGKSMIFSAKKSQNGLWQIWEMNLKNLKTHQITNSQNNCIDPAYLPKNRFVFSEMDSIIIAKKGIPLFTGNLDGSNIGQITFNPTANIASTVLKDGRILTLSNEIYPNHKKAMFMAMRPDGTKELLFHKASKGSSIKSGGFETTQGNIVFIASANNNETNHIISISYNNPFNSDVNLTQKIKGNFAAVTQLKGDTLLTSYKESKNNTYGLYEFDSKTNKLGKLIYKNEKFNLFDPVLIKKQQRPRDLPGEVNLKSSTGLMVCQNINFLNTLEKTSKAVKIEVLGLEGSLGKVPVEKDGSFYLKVLANTPFQIQTIDANEQIVNGPSSWLYLRPSERRGCIGCHENRMQVPENRQPLSVRKGPIMLPKQRKEVNKKGSIK